MEKQKELEPQSGPGKGATGLQMPPLPHTGKMKHTREQGTGGRVLSLPARERGLGISRDSKGPHKPAEKGAWMAQHGSEVTHRWFSPTRELRQVSRSYRLHPRADQKGAERNKRSASSSVRCACCNSLHRLSNITRNTEKRLREVLSLCWWEQAGEVAIILAELRTGC